MVFNINSKILAVYGKCGKNINYQLEFLLNSLDTEVCVAAMEALEEMGRNKAVSEVLIDDKNILLMEEVFGELDNLLVEKLVWIALMFPEV